MRFDELYVGDRFTAFGNLWTKTECDQARQHRAEGIALGDSGYGYRADTICSFGRDDEVKFVPPDAAEIARLRSALSRIAESGDDYGHRGLQHIAAEDLYVTPNVEFSGGAPLHGAASAGTQGYASGGQHGKRRQEAVAVHGMPRDFA